MRDLRPSPYLSGGAVGGASSGSSVIKGSAVLNVSGWDVDQTVSIPGVTPSMVAVFTLGAHSDADENHESMLSVVATSATTASGSVAFYMQFAEPTKGPVRINYMVS